MSARAVPFDLSHAHEASPLVWSALRPRGSAPSRQGHDGFFRGQMGCRGAGVAQGAILRSQNRFTSAVYRHGRIAKGNHEQAKNVLNQAYHDEDAPKHLVSIVLAECHLATQDYEQAQQLLDGLTDAEQALPRAKQILAQVAHAQQAWAQLIP